MDKITPTRAIILAAGRGSRMKDGTKNKPKALNKLAGKSMLDWQVETLKKAGISNLIVVGGYKNEMLVGEFTKVLNKNWMNTNMVSSMFCVEDFNGDTIISYSDIVYKSQHIKDLQFKSGDIVINADLDWKSLWEIRFKNPLDDAENFKMMNHKLQDIGGKSEKISTIQAQYMGLFKLTKKGWLKVKDFYLSLNKDIQKNIDVTSILKLMLMKKITIDVCSINGGWCEADSLKDIEIYEKMILSNNWKHDWR